MGVQHHDSLADGAGQPDAADPNAGLADQVGLGPRLWLFRPTFPF